MNFNEMQIIFTHFQGISVTPLGRNECISLYGNSMHLSRASQADGF